MSVRSMTGFAQARRPLAATEITVSVKSVNHRGLDLHFRMPPEFDPLEASIRAAVKRQVARGHVQVQVRVSNTEQLTPAVLNQGLLDTYLEAFRKTAAAQGLPGEPDLNAALRVPGMFQAAEAEADPQLEAAVLEALEEALAQFNEFRAREGGEIAAEMRLRNVTVRECAASMQEIRSRAVQAFQERLSARLADLLAGAGIDPQRLAQEVAILADRSDISEELTRLRVHSDQLEKLLASVDEIGKKIDFLLQEMHREANTILSKAAGVGELGLSITDLGLKAKAEIEKIREQGLNVE